MPTEDTSGFYKLDDETLLFAPNYVIHADWELHRDQKDGYDYPVHGWRWFDSRQDALDHHGIEEDDPDD